MLIHLLFLLEGSGEQIREFYKDIPEDIYYDILKVDPTGIIRNGKVDKVGKYSKHLLEIYKKTKFNKKDLEGLEDILKTYEKVQREISKPFNQIKTINEIKELVNNVSEKAKAEKGSKVLLKDSGYDLLQILTKDAAIYYGNYCGHGKTPKENQSSWCTSYKDGSYYEKYIKTGKLYILRKGIELICQIYVSSDGKSEEVQNRFNKPFIIKEQLPENLSKKIFIITGIIEQLSMTFAGRTVAYKIINDIIVFDNLNLNHCEGADFSKLPFINKNWTSNYINLNDNKLNINILKIIFKNLVGKIDEINVASCDIEGDFNNIFNDKIDSIQYCDFSNNKITKFSHKNKTEYIDLSNNKIKKLSDINVKNTMSINIEYNNISEISINDYKQFINIKFVEGKSLNTFDLMQDNFDKIFTGNPINTNEISISRFSYDNDIIQLTDKTIILNDELDKCEHYANKDNINKIIELFKSISDYDNNEILCNFNIDENIFYIYYEILEFTEDNEYIDDLQNVVTISIDFKKHIIKFIDKNNKTSMKKFNSDLSDLVIKFNSFKKLVKV